MPLAYLLVAAIVGALTSLSWAITGGGLIGGLTAYTLGGHLALVGCVTRRVLFRQDHL